VKLCSDEWILQADKVKSQTLYKKDQSIIKEGAQVLGVFFIQKGKVKVFSSGLNNREQIVRFAADGHILGHRGIGHDVYPVSAVSMEDSYICFIRNETLNEMFMANPKFPIALMMYYSRELRKLENRMKNMAQMNIRGKIAETLLLMLDHFGLNALNELNVPFSREDLARTAGSTRQQVVMQLTEFEKDGYIEKHGKKIALTNTQGLQKIICEFSQYTELSKHFADSTAVKKQKGS
jgi:CRP-like cAMP-binding protein